MVLEGVNASYNSVTKHFVFNMLGEGFSSLATDDMQEFLESLIPEEKRRPELTLVSFYFRTGKWIIEL